MLEFVVVFWDFHMEKHFSSVIWVGISFSHLALICIVEGSLPDSAINLGEEKKESLAQFMLYICFYSFFPVF